MTSDRPTLTLCQPDASLKGRSDDELMQLAAADLVEAYGELVRRYQRNVRGACAKMRRSSALGDDLAQEVFLQVWRSRRDYEPLGKFRSYLFTMVRNACRNATRGQALAHIEVATDRLPSADPGPLEALIAAQRRRRIQEYIEKLPRDQREAIGLRFGAGLEYAEVAQVAGRSEATIRSRVFLGLARLRKLLGKGTAP